MIFILLLLLLSLRAPASSLLLLFDVFESQRRHTHTRKLRTYTGAAILLLHARVNSIYKVGTTYTL